MGNCCISEDSKDQEREPREEAKSKVKQIPSSSQVTSKYKPPIMTTDNTNSNIDVKYNDDEAPMNSNPNTNRKFSSEVAMNQITIHVIQGRNLPAYDIGIKAKSDPYVTISIGNKRTFKTESIQRNLNPVWNSTFVEAGIGLFTNLNRIQFDVYDHDKFTKDDWMGCFVIEVPPKFHSDSLMRNTSIFTPIQWIPLRDKKNNKMQGEIQVQVKFVLDAEQLRTRYFTHILELNVKAAIDLRNMDFIGKSDPYVRVEWGMQSYKTRVIPDKTDHPLWDEIIFLFIHKEFQSKYQLKFTVLDKDFAHDDTLGCGYISAAEIFQSLDDDQRCTKSIKLRLQSVNFDKGLQEFDVHDSNGDIQLCGELIIECSVRPKKEFQKGFANAMFDMYDTDGNGYLDKFEVEKMLLELKVMDDNKSFDVNAWINKFDNDFDDTLNRDEVERMLNDVEFQDSPMSAKMIHLYLKKELHQPSKILMQPFEHSTHAQSHVEVLDRETGLIVQEFVPGYVSYALRLIYNLKIGRAIAVKSAGKKILKSMSVKKGLQMDSSKSREEIVPFIDQYAIDTKEFLHEIDEFKTFNDFFARPIDVEQYRPSISDDNMLVLSPADCRMVVFDTAVDISVWIKGSEFTLDKLLGVERVALLDDNPRLLGGSFFISRLAPQDYHRWHYPVSGVVTHITHIDGALYTVNPIAINKRVNVFTENKRCIVEIDAGHEIGSVVMFAIGATMVGSYNLYQGVDERDVKGTPLGLKVGDEVKVGDVAGEFRFGGSTILTLFEQGRIKFDDDLQQNSSNVIETLMKVRARVGRIIPRK